MARYRNQFGVVVNIPADKAARIIGLTPLKVRDTHIEHMFDYRSPRDYIRLHGRQQ